MPRKRDPGPPLLTFSGVADAFAPSQPDALEPPPESDASADAQPDISAIVAASLAPLKSRPATPRRSVPGAPDTTATTPDAPDALRQHEETAWYRAGERRRKLADQLLSHTPWADRDQRQHQTLVLAGEGAKLQARRGALICTPGWTHGDPEHPDAPNGIGAPTPVTLWPALHRVARIVILSEDGYVSLGALQLAAEMGITVSIISHRGQLVASMTAEAPADVLLRRAQHAVQADGRDVAIAHALIRKKLEAQRRTIAHHPELPDRERALDGLDMALSWFALDPPMPFLTTPNGIRMYEARAASAYFAAMRDLPLSWTKRSLRSIPPHWSVVGPRVSPLSTAGDARPAVSPFHAMLNYAYAALESACRTALVGQGFDVSVSLFHTERPTRPNYAPLVLDLLELGRADVDDRLLNFVAKTHFAAGDFRLLPSGECRLHPQLARTVIAACRLPQKQVDGYASWLRAALLDEAHAGQTAVPPRPQTRRKRR